MHATMSSVPRRNRLNRPRWLRDHIAFVITGLVVGNVLLIVLLVLLMR
jgi:hypothetical protein